MINTITCVLDRFQRTVTFQVSKNIKRGPETDYSNRAVWHSQKRRIGTTRVIMDRPTGMLIKRKCAEHCKFKFLTSVQTLNVRSASRFSKNDSWKLWNFPKNLTRVSSRVSEWYAHLIGLKIWLVKINLNSIRAIKNFTTKNDCELFS